MRTGAHKTLLVALLVACDGTTTLPSFAVSDLTWREIEPTPTYVLWWSELETCVGASGDFSQLRFAEVLAPLTESRQQFPCFTDRRLCSGVWEPPHDIYLASGMIGDERTVKHEMLHALLQSPEHGRPFFVCSQ